MRQLLRRTFGLGYSRWSRCSFCRKYHNQVAKLIDGDRCFICNECIMVCFNLLIEELGEEFDTINEQVHARRIGAIEGELRWLKKQLKEGNLTELAYEERQREVLRGNKLGKQDSGGKGD